MTNNQINAYGANVVNPANAANVTKTANAANAQATGLSSGSTSELGTQDFLNLLATQMSNQDVMNPMQDTQFISQMAQFTSLEAMQTLSQISASQFQLSASQYGASLVGKKVIVASYDDAGKYAEQQGVVDSVSFASGVCTLTVGGKKYNLSSVMQVVTEFPKTDPPVTDPPKTDPPVTDPPATDPATKI